MLLQIQTFLSASLLQLLGGKKHPPRVSAQRPTSKTDGVPLKLGLVGGKGAESGGVSFPDVGRRRPRLR